MMRRKYDGYEKWGTKKLKRIIKKVDKVEEKREEKTERQRKRVHLKGHRNKKNNIDACTPHTPQYTQDGLML